MWRATKDGRPVVLKRMLLENGFDVLLCGLREAFFGDELRSETSLARAASHFFVNGSVTLQTIFVREGDKTGGADNHHNSQPKQLPLSKEEFLRGGWQRVDMWIVFEDAGTSLRNLLYEDNNRNGAFVVVEPSRFWHRLRGPHGLPIVKDILRQLLQGIALLHRRGIVHRDVKPANVLVCDADASAGDAEGAAGQTATRPRRCGPWATKTNSSTMNESTSNTNSSSKFSQDGSAAQQRVVRLADFSSAFSQRVVDEGLYGSNGPLRNDLTIDYAPQEVLFGNSSDAAAHTAQTYDMWSVGVLFLELLLGTPDVFTIDGRTRALLTQKLSNWSKPDLEQAFLKAALAEFCIYHPSAGHWPFKSQVHKTKKREKKRKNSFVLVWGDEI